MPPKEDCKKRFEDRVSVKLGKIAAAIAAITVVTGATIKVLSYEFVKNDDYIVRNTLVDERINLLRNDQTRIDTKLDAIAEDVSDIKKDIKDLLKKR